MYLCVITYDAVYRRNYAELASNSDIDIEFKIGDISPYKDKNNLYEKSNDMNSPLIPNKEGMYLATIVDLKFNSLGEKCWFWKLGCNPVQTEDFSIVIAVGDNIASTLIKIDEKQRIADILELIASSL